MIHRPVNDEIAPIPKDKCGERAKKTNSIPPDFHLPISFYIQGRIRSFILHPDDDLVRCYFTRGGKCVTGRAVSR